MVHIPQHLILPQDTVKLHDMGPQPPKFSEKPSHVPESVRKAAHEQREAEFAAARSDWEAKHGMEPVSQIVHVSDAMAAMQASPDRYVLAAEQMFRVYDLGEPKLVNKAQADALVASDRSRYRVVAAPDVSPADKA